MMTTVEWHIDLPILKRIFRRALVSLWEFWKDVLVGWALAILSLVGVVHLQVFNEHTVAVLASVISVMGLMGTIVMLGFTASVIWSNFEYACMRIITALKILIVLWLLQVSIGQILSINYASQNGCSQIAIESNAEWL